jgi:WD40 repeat protein/serine/threonine protein kinase
MALDPQGLKELFLAAVELSAPAERAAFVDRACGAEEELRRRLEALLRAHDDPGSYLEEPDAGVLHTDGPQSGRFLRPSEVARAAAPTEEVGSRVGPYKLLQKLGEGGMGVVFLAEQEEPLRRQVALKIIKPGMDSARVTARFEVERQALAMMDHQNIAKVFEAGTTGSGLPYFVMELVQGRPITSYCDENKLTLRDRLTLFVPVCQAIQHAHQKGIIHRDIKPSNVLVALVDGVPVAKVIDFGVAKAVEQRLTEGTLFTQVGTLVGTFEYMSPEQAEMNPLGIDTRSDVYSLGVLLYELLTGTTPLERQRLHEAAFGEIVRLIKEENPPPPSMRLSTSGALATAATRRGTEPARLARLVKGELDWIVLKCLEKDRTRRYETAVGLARDVEHHLKDEPIVARPSTAWERTVKWARRRPALAGLLAVSAAATLVLIVGLATAYLVTEGALRGEAEAQQELRRSLDNETRARKDAERTAYYEGIALAHSEWRGNDVPRARQHLAACPSHLRGWEWHYLWRLCQTQRTLSRRVQRWKQSVRCLAYSPDGKRLAVGGDEHLVRILDVASGKEVLTLAHRSPVLRVTFSRDGKRLASASSEIKLWDTATGKELLNIPGPHGFRALALSPDGKWLAGAPPGWRPVKIWDAETGKELRVLKKDDKLPHEDSAEALAFRPSDAYLTTATATNHGIQLRAWWVAKVILEPGPPERTHMIAVPNATERRQSQRLNLAYRPDGWQLAVTSATDDAIRLVKPITGQVVHTLNEHVGSVRAVAYSPDGKQLASAGADRTVRLWDVATGRLLHTFHGHSEEVWCVAFSPDGRKLASGSGGVDTFGMVAGEVMLWDTHRSQEALVLPVFNAKTNFATSPDGRFLAVRPPPSVPDRVQVWDLEAGRMVHEATGQQVVALGGRPDGTLLGLLVQGGPVQVWAVAPPRPVCTLEGWVEQPRVGNAYDDRASFSPDGRLVALADFQNELRVWDAVTGHRLWGQRFEGRNLLRIAFSPDSRRLAVQVTVQLAPGEQPTQFPADLRLHHAVTGEVLHTLRRPGEFEAFSPDGRFLLLREWDGQLKIEGKHPFEGLIAWRRVVRVVDAADGMERATLRPRRGTAAEVAFSPDRRHVALAVWDMKRPEVAVWDLTTGRAVSTLRDYHSFLGALTFSPDGRRLVTGGDDGTVRLWDPFTGEEVLTLRGHRSRVKRLAFTRGGRHLVSLGEDRTVRVWDARPIGEMKSPTADPK